MGHEFVGRIAHAPAGSGLALGQRVVVQPVVGCGRCGSCRAGRPNICPERQLIGAHRPGGFADLVAVPLQSIYPIPDGLDDSSAPLVEPLANAVHIVQRAEGARTSIAVIGAGTLGVLTAAVARLAGYRRIVVTDVNRARLQIASLCGATDVFDASHADTAAQVLEVTEGGADLVVEAVGIEVTRRTAIGVAAPGAEVVLLGNAEPESGLPVNAVVNRELRLRGSYSSTDAEFRRAIGILTAGDIETATWTREAPLERGPDCFERLASGAETRKILLRV
jgi:threonine dehydrogenase-like Zn-dependent dehydrogenase